MKKRFLSAVLSIMLILCSFPTLAFGENVSYCGIDYSSNSTIASRLDSVFSEYIPWKQYFVSDGGQNLSGNKNYPCSYYGNGHGYFDYGYQCLGYCRWVQNKLFNTYEYTNGFNEDYFDTLDGAPYLTPSSCKNWFQSNASTLHPGAHIRVWNYGHSVSFLSQDSNGVSIIHCNWGKDCSVKLSYFTWDEFVSTFLTIDYCNYYKNYYTKFPSTASPISYEIGIYSVNTPMSTLNIRSAASVSSTVLASIPDGTELEITQISGSWGQTSYNNISGWVSLSYVTFSAPFDVPTAEPEPEVPNDSSTGIYSVNTPGNVLNMRSSYSTSSSVLTRIPDGSTVIVSEIKNGWGKTEYNGFSGWISLDYATFISKYKYTLVYNSNGTGEDNRSQTVSDGKSFTLLKNNFNYAGYVFDGWELQRNSDGYRYTNESGWCNESTVIANNYTKLKLADGITVNIADSWVGSSLCETYTLLATWIPEVYISSITVNSLPDKLQYYVGEVFDSSGLSLNLNYSDGTVETVSHGFSYDRSPFASAGKQGIEIGYSGLHTTVDINVLSAAYLRMDNSGAISGSLISVPIYITASSFARSGEMVIKYDSNTLKFSGVTTGSLFNGSSPIVSSGYANDEIYISFSSASPVTSAGTVITLNFNVIGENGKTDISISSAKLYTKEKAEIPVFGVGCEISVFNKKTDTEEDIFKFISYSTDAENINFTVITNPLPINRIKVSYSDKLSEYIKYTSSYSIDSSGNYVWSLTVPITDGSSSYAFDARSSETGKYLGRYEYCSVPPEGDRIFKSVEASVDADYTTFTVVTAPGNYNRLRVGQGTSASDSISVASNYSSDINGNYIWTVSIPTPEKNTCLFFDLRDSQTNSYLRSYYGYYLKTDLLFKSISFERTESKTVFTVVTAPGNYNRLRLGLKTSLSDNLSTSSSYTVNSNGDYVWSLSIPDFNTKTILYFDLRNADTNFYSDFCYQYVLSPSSTIKSVSKTSLGNKTVFSVTTVSGDFSRLRVGTQESLANNLAVSSDYSKNHNGDFVWTISFATPCNDTTLYFDLRDCDNKYIKDYYLYYLSV